MSENLERVKRRVKNVEEAIVMLTQMAIRADERMDEADERTERADERLDEHDMRMAEINSTLANVSVKLEALTDAQIRNEDAVASARIRTDDAISRLTASQAGTAKDLKALIKIVRQIPEDPDSRAGSPP